MKKEVSIIIPVYNVEKCLIETLDSVLKQTFTDFELILIDDGSTDKTSEICDEYAKKDGRVMVVHQINGGVSCARNAGIVKAAAKYVCFIDGDDYVDPRMIETLYKNAIEYNVDISCCGIRQKTLDGSVNDEYCDGRKVYIDNMNELIESFFSDRVYKEVLYGPYNKLFKRELLTGLRFNQNYKIGEDLLFSFECIEKAKSFYFENIGLYHYIKREGSATTSRFSVKRFDYIYVADILLEKCKNKYPFAYKEALLWTYVHKINMCRSLCKYKTIRRNNEDFYKKCKNFCKENKSEVWAKLPFRKKVDYYLIRLCPFIYKLV